MSYKQFTTTIPWIYWHLSTYQQRIDKLQLLTLMHWICQKNDQIWMFFLEDLGPRVGWWKRNSWRKWVGLLYWKVSHYRRFWGFKGPWVLKLQEQRELHWCSITVVVWSGQSSTTSHKKIKFKIWLCFSFKNLKKF